MSYNKDKMARTNETVINKADLFNYLDGFLFANNEEVEFAICDFIETQEWELYYSDCALASELANEYINKKELNIPYYVDGVLVDYSETF